MKVRTIVLAIILSVSIVGAAEKKMEREKKDVEQELVNMQFMMKFFLSACHIHETMHLLIADNSTKECAQSADASISEDYRSLSKRVQKNKTVSTQLRALYTSWSAMMNTLPRHLLLRDLNIEQANDKRRPEEKFAEINVDFPNGAFK